MKVPMTPTGAKSLRLAVYAATVLSPVVVLFLLLHCGFGAAPGDYVPWSSDNVDYWHETLSFQEKGLACGYYGYEEKPASLGRYGGHGPFFPMLYGALARLTGWEYGTAVFYNTALLVLAWAAFLSLLRPSLKESLFHFTFALTFTPVFYWQVALMQEPMQFALAIVLAGLFALFLERRERRQAAGPGWTLFAFVFLASLLRPTWAFLFIPLFLLVRKGGSLAKPLLAAVALIGLSAASYAVFVAPYPYDPSLLRDVIDLALGGPAGPLWEHARYNTTEVFTNRNLFYPNLVSYEILFFLGFCLTWLAWLRTRGQGGGHEGLVPRLVTATFLVVAMFGFLFCIYVVNGSLITKHLAPAFVFGILILARRLPLKYCYLFIAINILTMPAFLANVRSTYYTSYVKSGFLHKQIDAFKASISPFIVYEPDAPPWCNTMAMTNFPGVISALPAGVAFNNVYFKETLQAPLKSRYILVASQEAHDEIAKRNSIELLTRTAYGDLYLNKSSPCFATTRQDALPSTP
jgi:hypothetical protein